MFERPRTGETAVLVHLSLEPGDDAPAIEEFQALASSAGARCVGLIGGHRRSPDARYFVGTGKAEEIKALVDAQQAELVIFDHELSPSQERNLEQLLQCRVLDRTGLILDIFAQRARSHEGKLQVELAQLKHLSTRLVRGWTHLERQKGGIGLRGPGETQLETDRRLLGERIKQIHKRLEKVEQHRNLSRNARQRAELPTVSLVGYTNAGKSTLFNQLTHAGVYAADQLFATLDPTLRRLQLPGGESLVLADTVGFVSRLPHELVAAFRSTLQETTEADWLLHVIDASDEQREAHIREVEQVLGQIGADAIPCLRIYNKIDRLDGVLPRVECNDQGQAQAVWLSAATAVGLELLLTTLGQCLGGAHVSVNLALPADAGRLRARLFAHNMVVDEQTDEQGGWCLTVQGTRHGLAEVCRREGYAALWQAATAHLPPLEPNP